MSIREMHSRGGGAALVTAGLLTTPYWFLHPAAADPRAVQGIAYFEAMGTFSYSIVTRGFLVIILACLFGLLGLYSRFADRLGPWGLVWTVAGTAGNGLFLAAGTFTGFVAPVLARDAATRHLLAIDGPFLKGPLAAVFASAGLLFAAGNMGVACLVLRRGLLLRTPLMALIASVPILGLSPLMPLPVRAAGCVVFGISYVALGAALLKTPMTPTIAADP